MTLELLYLAGCPHHDEAVELVNSVLEAEGIPLEVQQILIRNREDAAAHSFPGSPTVRVNGQDIERNSRNRMSIGFACRTYLVEGKMQGVPPRSWLEKAIRAARTGESSMKGVRATTALTPLAAVMSALAALACCLPWGLAAAMGALGLSAFFTRFQAEFLVLALVLLAVGLAQILRRGRSCRRRSRFEIALWTIAAAIVLAVVLFPQWVASLLVR